MWYSKKAIPVFVCVSLMSTSVCADGIFLTKKRSSHDLSKAEMQRIDKEFLQKFGSSGPVRPLTTGNNPWKAKKQREQVEPAKTVSWGQCREYSLQKRNICYKEGRQAYNCERLYEARSKKCNDDY